MVMAMISGPVVRWILHGWGMVQWDEVWKSTLSALVAVVVLYVITFLYYFLKRKSLPDPPRQLTIKHQQKIANYLRPYSPNRIVRLITILACVTRAVWAKIFKSCSKG